MLPADGFRVSTGIIIGNNIRKMCVVKQEIKVNTVISRLPTGSLVRIKTNYKKDNRHR